MTSSSRATCDCAGRFRQHPVGPYFLDQAYVDAEVFVELDGWGAHGSPEAFGRDRRRQNDIVLLDWVPLRFTRSDVHRFPRRTAVITRDDGSPASGASCGVKQRTTVFHATRMGVCRRSSPW